MILKGKTVLVTGGTGSFGKEFVRQALQHCPKKVIIFSRDELKQFEMARIYSDAISNSPMRYFIGDIRDEARLKKALKDVDIIVHAAALKQVPAAEYNPTEAIATNIQGTQNVINAAIACHVRKTIFLSTDKAVEPCNLYGCTKAVAEKLMVNANLYSDYSRFSVVRYGNVMGSRGSVIPFFKSLVDEGKAIPITDMEMTRFLITIEDAVGFVIDSLGKMFGGEIFIPKLGSVKIADLARKVAGRDDYPFEVIGIRPGEKVHEVLISKNERNVADMQDRFVIHPTYNVLMDDETSPPRAYCSIGEYSSNATL